jgi:acyl carrier protein
MSKSLPDLLKEAFPTAVFDVGAADLGLNSFPEWDSLGHFNFMLLLEETYGIRFSVDEMSELKTLPQIRTVLGSRGVAA